MKKKQTDSINYELICQQTRNSSFKSHNYNQLYSLKNPIECKINISRNNNKTHVEKDDNYVTKCLSCLIGNDEEDDSELFNFIDETQDFVNDNHPNHKNKSSIKCKPKLSNRIGKFERNSNISKNKVRIYTNKQVSASKQMEIDNNTPTIIVSNNKPTNTSIGIDTPQSFCNVPSVDYANTVLKSCFGYEDLVNDDTKKQPGNIDDPSCLDVVINSVMGLTDSKYKNSFSMDTYIDDIQPRNTHLVKDDLYIKLHEPDNLNRKVIQKVIQSNENVSCIEDVINSCIGLDSKCKDNELHTNKHNKTAIDKQIKPVNLQKRIELYTKNKKENVKSNGKKKKKKREKKVKYSQQFYKNRPRSMENMRRLNKVDKSEINYEQEYVKPIKTIELSNRIYGEHSQKNTIDDKQMQVTDKGIHYTTYKDILVKEYKLLKKKLKKAELAYLKKKCENRERYIKNNMQPKIIICSTSHSESDDDLLSDTNHKNENDKKKDRIIHKSKKNKKQTTYKIDNLKYTENNEYNIDIDCKNSDQEIELDTFNKPKLSNEISNSPNNKYKLAKHIIGNKLQKNEYPKNIKKKECDNYNLKMLSKPYDELSNQVNNHFNNQNIWNESSNKSFNKVSLTLDNHLLQQKEWNESCNTAYNEMMNGIDIKFENQNIWNNGSNKAYIHMAQQVDKVTKLQLLNDIGKLESSLLEEPQESPHYQVQKCKSLNINISNRKKDSNITRYTKHQTNKINLCDDCHLVKTHASNCIDNPIIKNVENQDPGSIFPIGLIEKCIGINKDNADTNITCPSTIPLNNQIKTKNGRSVKKIKIKSTERSKTPRRIKNYPSRSHINKKSKANSRDYSSKSRVDSNLEKSEAARSYPSKYRVRNKSKAKSREYSSKSRDGLNLEKSVVIRNTSKNRPKKKKYIRSRRISRIMTIHTSNESSNSSRSSLFKYRTRHLLRRYKSKHREKRLANKSKKRSRIRERSIIKIRSMKKTNKRKCSNRTILLRNRYKSPRNRYSKERKYVKMDRIHRKRITNEKYRVKCPEYNNSSNIEIIPVEINSKHIQGNIYNSPQVIWKYHPRIIIDQPNYPYQPSQLYNPLIQPSYNVMDNIAVNNHSRYPNNYHLNIPNYERDNYNFNIDYAQDYEYYYPHAYIPTSMYSRRHDNNHYNLNGNNNINDQCVSNIDNNLESDELHFNELSLSKESRIIYICKFQSMRFKNTNNNATSEFISYEVMYLCDAANPGHIKTLVVVPPQKEKSKQVSLVTRLRI